MMFFQSLIATALVVIVATTAKGALTVAETSSACTMYPAPRNGALGCINITFSSLGVVPICYAMCKSEFDFVSKAERIYICYQRQWQTRLLEPALPWPGCSAAQGPKAMSNLFYFDGNPNDANVVDAIKDDLLNLLGRDLLLCDYPGENPPGQCTKDKFKVKAGELSD